MYFSIKYYTFIQVSYQFKVNGAKRPESLIEQNCHLWQKDSRPKDSLSKILDKVLLTPIVKINADIGVVIGAKIEKQRPQVNIVTATTNLMPRS